MHGEPGGQIVGHPALAPRTAAEPRHIGRLLDHHHARARNLWGARGHQPADARRSHDDTRGDGRGSFHKSPIIR